MEDQEYRDKIKEIIQQAIDYPSTEFRNVETMTDEITRLSASHFATPQMEVDLGRVFTEQDVLFMIEMLLQRPDLLMDAVQNDQTDYDNQALFEVAYLDLMDAADSPRQKSITAGNELSDVHLVLTLLQRKIKSLSFFNEAMANDFQQSFDAIEKIIHSAQREMSDEEIMTHVQRHEAEGRYDYTPSYMLGFQMGMKHYRSERNRLNKVIATTQD